MKVRADADRSLVDYLCEHLSAYEPRFRRMFGAYGLYAGEVFFAIVSEGRVYFKTNPMNRPDYEAAGMGPLYYSETAALWTFYELPLSILEDPLALPRWAQGAIQAGCQAAEAKAERSRRKPKR